MRRSVLLCIPLIGTLVLAAFAESPIEPGLLATAPFTCTYTESVPVHDHLVVELVPDRLTLEFDAIARPGRVWAYVMDSQPCPAPEGVEFFSEFYEVTTSAAFRYIASITLMTETELPAGVKAEEVRVFVRPSGECQTWRDITVRPTEILPPFESGTTLRSLTRTQSEDDEFSVFALAADRRPLRDVIILKFSYLEDAITSNEQWIPEEVYDQLNTMLNDARLAAGRKRVSVAAAIVGRMADVVREAEGIPHTYDPQGTTPNVAGKIIGRAHTLAFSLRGLIKANRFGETLLEFARMITDPSGGGSLPEFTVEYIGTGVVIHLSGRTEGPVSLNIYSVDGRLVSNLLDGETVGEMLSVHWDGLDSRHARVAPGVYYAVLQCGRQRLSEKIALIR
jgi:hypothetical protein